MFWRMRIDILELTHDTVFQTLVVTNSTGIPFAFVLLTVEVLDSLVVQQAVGVDSTSNLIKNAFSVEQELCKSKYVPHPCRSSASAASCAIS